MKIIRWVTPTLAVVQAEKGESLTALALAGVQERQKIPTDKQPIIWPEHLTPKELEPYGTPF